MRPEWQISRVRVGVCAGRGDPTGHRTTAPTGHSLSVLRGTAPEQSACPMAATMTLMANCVPSDCLRCKRATSPRKRTRKTATSKATTWLGLLFHFATHMPRQAFFLLAFPFISSFLVSLLPVLYTYDTDAPGFGYVAPHVALPPVWFWLSLLLALAPPPATA